MVLVSLIEAFSEGSLCLAFESNCHLDDNKFAVKTYENKKEWKKYHRDDAPTDLPVFADITMLFLVALHLSYQTVIGYESSSSDKWNTRCERGKTPILVVNFLLMTFAIWTVRYPDTIDEYLRFWKRILLWVIIVDELMDSLATNLCINNAKYRKYGLLVISVTNTAFALFLFELIDKVDLRLRMKLKY